MLDALIHVAVVLLLPPLLLGVVNRVKARVGGRMGPPLWQPYYDLRRLLGKGMVFSTATTWVFRAGPVVGLVATLLAAMLIPLGAAQAPVRFPGDFVLFAYLFALGRFALATAALDTGSAFEGMGTAREITYACLAEPAMFCGFLVLARLSDGLTLGGMLAGPASLTSAVDYTVVALVAVSWFILLLLENCRIPFDDPNTHLELTMIHEVMVLDHSGPALGLIQYAAAVKLFVFAAVLVRLVVPLPTAVPGLAWLALIAGTLLVAAGVGLVESTMARLRLPRIPNLAAAAGALAAFAFVLLLSEG